MKASCSSLFEGRELSQCYVAAITDRQEHRHMMFDKSNSV